MFRKNFCRLFLRKWSLAGVISLFALSISLLSLYFSQFHVEHELSYSYESNTNHDLLTMEDGTFLVFYNSGNQNEIVLDVYISVEFSDTVELAYGIGPHIIPSANSVIVSVPENLIDCSNIAREIFNRKGINIASEDLIKYYLMRIKS